jgi:menaquinol-cytochrome c reductase iron-sulfur subunit
MMQDGQTTPTERSTEALSGESVTQTGHSRRVFLFKLSLFVNAAVGVVLGVPLIGYLLGPALTKKADDTSWISLGPLSDFPISETLLVNFRNPFTTTWDGETGEVPCWVRRVSESSFQVFAINCAHLGCPVRWFAQSKLFMCPCHGGAYYADGSRASGPPERGLFEYDHKIADGNLMISAGKMPTLAPTPGFKASLVRLETGDSAERLAGIEKPKPRCGSCQA